MMTRIAVVVGLLLTMLSTAQAEPEDFSEAKRLLRDHVYADQNQSSSGDFYCGCKWEWAGKSGGVMDPEGCGFKSAQMADRASRLEWEHTVPAYFFGQQRQCWRDGGRKNCELTDPVFNRIEADMFNLVPSIGTANALRSNISYGMAVGPSIPLGACTTKVGIFVKVVEPRDEVKGEAARNTFYMADRYNLQLSDKQQQVLMAWDRSYPVSAWEKERDRRISYSMGHHNPFVTGERHWVPGYKPLAEGLAYGADLKAVQLVPTNKEASAQSPIGLSVRGNIRSHIYHLSEGCPGYEKISEPNRVAFDSEAAALNAGYRRAGNCL
jgi:deoxyribonuclease-1